MTETRLTRIEPAGARRGKLTVLRTAERDKSGKLRLKVRCDCGNETVIYQQHFRSGATVSCGCLRLAKLKAANDRRHERAAGRKVS